MKQPFIKFQMKKTLLTASIILSGLVYSQVGVNNQTPSTIFDVRAKRDASGNITDNAQTIGMQAPRLTRTELTANTATYGSNQNGALIYITDISGGNANAGTQRENVASIGYYYFDAAATSGAGRWVKMAVGNSGNAYTANNGLTMSGTNVKLGGDLTEPTTISSLTATNKLSITGTGVDAVNIASGTLSVDASNKRIGINNTAPQGLLHVKSVTAGSGIDSGIFGINNCGDPCAQTVTASNLVMYNSNVNNSIFGGIDLVAASDPAQPSAASISGIDRDATNNYAGLSFNTRNASGFSSKMVVKASGKVGIGTTTPNDSSILDVTSTTAGFLMPRLTTTQMNNITSPAGGLQVYNTDEKCTFLYNGTNWRSLCARTFQQGSEGATLVSRGSSADLTQSITLAGTQNITVQISFNPQAWTNTSNGYAFGTYSILIDGNVVTGGMRYATQNAGNNLYRYSAVGTWTTTLAPGSHTIIFRVISDSTANGATVDTNAEDRRMIVTVN